MPLELIAVTLTLAGTIIMMAALHPAVLICRAQGNERQKRAWKTLVFFIFIFVLAYMLFLGAITTFDMSTVDLAVSALLLGGSCFVILVLNMSLVSIKEIKRVAAQERHNALHDQLTNLPNRTLLYESMHRAIASAKRKKSTLMLLIMDLNQFKEINDTLGHHCGDQLLQALVPRLQAAIRDADIIARLGGDEFAVVLTETDLNGARIVSRRIIESMEEPLSIGNYDLKIGVSIGIARYPADGSDCDTLIKKADIAMYVAKHGNDNVAVYNPVQDLHSIKKLNITRKLHDAIQNDILKLHFQPIVNLKTGRVSCFEVLSRWHDNDLGFIPPDEFIPIAEQTGSIKQLTLWMLETAIRQFQQWQAFIPTLHLSINMTAQDIQDTFLIRNITGILSKYAFNPQKLHIEITESNMMTHSRHTREVISQLHGLGVSLSIDDFGTGFSSLSYLKQLPTQTIKIDKSFVTDLTGNSSDEVIVRSVINIAHNMDQVVIAEGIEDAACLEHLQALNCDFGQGYYFSKPLPAEEVLPWLKSRGEFTHRAAS